MADFIAVIRRAVDGLSENTPEMRAKVYERAKSAVVRQLENMKPRPPEVMFQRQIDKLDAAIREVEAEHAEAVPVEPPAVEPVAFAPEPVEEQPVAEPVASPPAQFEEPVRHSPVVTPTESLPVTPAVQTAVPVREMEQEPVVAVAPVVAPAVAEPEPLAEATRQFEASAEPLATVTGDPSIPAYVTSEPADAEPEARLAPEMRPAQLDVQTYDETPDVGTVESSGYVPQQADAYVAPVGAYEAMVEPIEEKTTVVVNETVPVPPPVQMTIESELAAKAPDVAVQPAKVEPKPAPVEQKPVAIAEPEPAVLRSEEEGWELEPLDRRTDRQPRAESVPQMPKVSYDETDVVEGFNDFLKQELNRQVVPPPPSKAKKQDDFAWDAPFDDLPEIDKPPVFDAALEAKQAEIAETGKKNGGKRKQPEPANARAELEDLIGIEPSQRRSSDPIEDEVTALAPDAGRGVSKLEGKTFKMQKKKKRRKLRLLPIGIAAAAVLVLSGSGYALWHYRDDVSQLVASLMPSETPAKTTTVPKTDVKSEIKSPVTTTDTKTQTAEAKTPDAKAEDKPTEVASLNTDIGPQKFTQRLLPDGSETDTDAAKVPVDQALQEGKTIAGQTEKSKEVAETTATDTKTDATATNPGVPQSDAQPLGASQKMYLYEERLGQTSPVAVPGTVVWREKTDTEDGKPNPSIEASLDVPSRKITASITFKRNTDPSLPASHIIEIAFALPKDFEEGNVDSIQRVAFKQTEQERGNPLIAVPAKITDDFHMVALNDDADARKVNLELMKTRGWIDIPITYRNGRRALITLEKGTTGTAVFDKVMAQWDALGRQASTAN